MSMLKNMVGGEDEFLGYWLSFLFKIVFIYTKFLIKLIDNNFSI